MFTDRYGLNISTSPVDARDAYVTALDRFLAAGDDFVPAFAQAIVRDPGLALAHAAYARCLAFYGRGPEAREAIAQARELSTGATRRERQHVEAIALMLDGRPGAALTAALSHLDEFPRDAMVLGLVTGVFGLYGTSGRHERERLLLDLLDRLAPSYGDDGWFLSQHAFAQCEGGHLARAEAKAERALELNPANGWAAHSRAHIHYELGEKEAYDRFLGAWLPTYPSGAQLHGHLSWHAAIGAVMLGDAERALDLFQAYIDPGEVESAPLIVLTDSISLLWRMELAGRPRQHGLWPKLRRYGMEKFPQAGATFADVHNAIAFAVTGDRESAERLLAQMRTNVERQWASDIGEPIARGVAAFVRGDWGAAIDAIAPAIDGLVRISGSRAQRDVVLHTLLAAYLRAGRADEAEALIGTRFAPHRSASVAH